MSSSRESIFKSFDDYTEIQRVFKYFVAKEKLKTRDESDTYEDKWYLISRPGLFHAQVEKAMSEIYQYFLGYSTDIEILKQHDDYYIASRGIRHFEEWHPLIKQTEDSLLITRQGETKAISGLGNICALARFFCDTDAHYGNLGLQYHQAGWRVFKIDNEHALSFDESIGIHFDQEFEYFSNNTDYKNEYHAMRKKIASTHFSIMEDILRRNITSNKAESGITFIHKLLKEATDPEETKELLEILQKAHEEDPAKYGVDAHINELRKRHQALREELHMSLLSSSSMTLFPLREAKTTAVGAMAVPGFNP